ncbi:MAG: DUF5946 family protein [Chloroflexota bacterium]|jgi:hypothetical protein
MDQRRECPECGAPWDNGRTCQDCFHQMLAWEWEDTRNQAVHHLMVLSYHLQHPSLYSPESLADARRLLFEFLERGVSSEEIRKRRQTELDSRNRKWKIKGTAAIHGSYDPPVRWTITAVDVIAGGIDRYCDSVRAWARSILDALKA